MKIMVVGGGGREHAIIKKLKENQSIETIYALPGNGGIAADAVCVDIGAKAEIHKMISALASQGKGIIMISSEMPEILGMSDRIIVIHEGRKKGELLRENASQQAIMEMMLAQ